MDGKGLRTAERHLLDEDRIPDMTRLPESLRTFLDEGGALEELGVDALDRIAATLIVDRILHAAAIAEADSWIATQERTFGPIAEQPEPEYQYRSWDVELLSDPSFAERVELLLPPSCVAAAFEAVQVKRLDDDALVEQVERTVTQAKLDTLICMGMEWSLADDDDPFP